MAIEIISNSVEKINIHSFLSFEWNSVLSIVEFRLWIGDTYHFFILAILRVGFHIEVSKVEIFDRVSCYLRLDFDVLSNPGLNLITDKVKNTLGLIN
jgi:hypothetical protein